MQPDETLRLATPADAGAASRLGAAPQLQPALVVAVQLARFPAVAPWEPVMAEQVVRLAAARVVMLAAAPALLRGLAWVYSPALPVLSSLASG